MTTKTKKPAAKKAAAKKEPRVSMASVAYEMIKAGKTNAEVLAKLQKDFSLPAKHNYYPSWYRSKLVQTSQISKKFAEDNSGEPTKAEKASKKKPAAKPAAPKKAAKAAGLATASN